MLAVTWSCLCELVFTECGGTFAKDKKSRERGEENAENVSLGAVERGFYATVRSVARSLRLSLYFSVKKPRFLVLHSHLRLKPGFNTVRVDG